MESLQGAVIIPTLNESFHIRTTLRHVLSVTQGRWKVIVVDGGSEDGTLAYIREFDVECISSLRGRASQMHAGAMQARPYLNDDDVMIFLHADTRLPEKFCARMAQFKQSPHLWGRFNVALSGEDKAFRRIERMINWRSRNTGIATGDQAMFFKNAFYWQLDGFPRIPLMEDVAMSKAAKAQMTPLCIPDPVITSSRKWEEKGIIKTVLLMWICRGAYALGVDPHRIHRWYYG